MHFYIYEYEFSNMSITFLADFLFLNIFFLFFPFLFMQLYILVFFSYSLFISYSFFFIHLVFQYVCKLISIFRLPFFSLQSSSLFTTLSFMSSLLPLIFSLQPSFFQIFFINQYLSNFLFLSFRTFSSPIFFFHSPHSQITHFVSLSFWYFLVSLSDTRICLPIFLSNLFKSAFDGPASWRRPDYLP